FQTLYFLNPHVAYFLTCGHVRFIVIDYSFLNNNRIINQSINQSSLTSVSSSGDDIGDALSGHSKIHTHHPCDENTDPLREMPVPVPKSNKSVQKKREKLWRKQVSLKPRTKR